MQLKGMLHVYLATTSIRLVAQCQGLTTRTVIVLSSVYFKKLSNRRWLRENFPVHLRTEVNGQVLLQSIFVDPLCEIWCRRSQRNVVEYFWAW
jgi:hypothetical protein